MLFDFMAGRSALIGARVGPGQDNRPEDVGNVARALGHFGYPRRDRRPVPAGRFTPGLGDAIGRYQRDAGLAPDRVFGPLTEIDVLARRMEQLSGAGDGGLGRRRRGRAVLAAGAPDLTAEAYSTNRRAVDTLGRHTDPGDYHRWLAGALRQDGAAAVGEVADLLGQLTARDGPLARKMFARLERELKAGPARLGAGRAGVDRGDLLAGLADVVAGAPAAPGRAEAEAAEAVPEKEETAAGPAAGTRPKKDEADRAADGDLPPLIGRVLAGLVGPHKLVLQAGAVVGRTLGLDMAADHLERFLGGSGAKQTYSREQVREIGPIFTAEKKNRIHFENGTLVAKSDDEKVNDELRRLKDGDRATITDNFIVDFLPVDQLKFVRDGEIDLLLGSGQSKVRSVVTFTATREGDVIRVEGTITHNWADTYDFDPKKPSGMLPWLVEAFGQARRFPIEATWRQRLRGTVRIVNGVLTDPRVTWEDID